MRGVSGTSLILLNQSICVFMIKRHIGGFAFFKSLEWLFALCLLSFIPLTISLFFILSLEVESNRFFAFSYCLLLFFLFVCLALMSKVRKSTYVHVGEYFHAVVHMMRDALAGLEYGGSKQKQPGYDDTFHMTITESLDLIARLFTIITRVPCSVCIKEIISDSNDPSNPLIKTLERDHLSRVKRKIFDNERDSAKNFLKDSSAFCEIFSNFECQHNYFFSNDIMQLYKKHKYNNATFAKVGMPFVKKKFGFFSVLKWPLPYKATIVLPIMHKESRKFLGFLCVDANQKNVFDKDLHVQLGAAFADLFYLFFMSYRKRVIDSSIIKRLEEIAATRR